VLIRPGLEVNSSFAQWLQATSRPATKYRIALSVLDISMVNLGRLTAHELSGAPPAAGREAGHGCGTRPLERKVRPHSNSVEQLPLRDNSSFPALKSPNRHR